MKPLRRYFDPEFNAWVKVYPAARVLGADDLSNWSRRRSAGRSGSDGGTERKDERRWLAKPKRAVPDADTNFMPKQKRRRPGPRKRAALRKAAEEHFGRAQAPTKP
jgi:hypothetical protein